MKKLKTIVVGCGNMGSSHARSYHKLPGFELAGVVDRNAQNREKLSIELGVDSFDDFDIALAKLSPDVVSICTYPDTHASLAMKSLQAGAHLFIEKPLAVTVAEAEKIVELAVNLKKKITVGYILRVHPSWKKFIELARNLGSPLVMRMNLNQQSSGKTWETHLKLMNSMSPIVDCGVHYVDVMCQMTRSKPVRVNAIGARLTDQVAKDMYNYGQLQVTFADGSVGWYEAGWGPMMSQAAFFVKDVIGPKGSVSIMDPARETESDDVSSHTKTNRLLLHHSGIDPAGNFLTGDEIIVTEDEPDHQGLCDLEQQFLYDAIVNNTDLSDHLEDAIASLRIVLAADESFRTGKPVELAEKINQ